MQKPKRKCLDCGKQLTVKIAKRCKTCSNKYNAKKRKSYKGRNNPFYGKKHSEESKHLISKKHADFKGEKSTSFGVKRSDNTKRLISENHADFSGEKNSMYGKRGKLSPLYGRKHSKESIEKMRNSRYGEKNPAWIDGRSYEPYPKEFTTVLKNKIKARDKYICQNCGMNEKEHILKYKRRLEVHHIDYEKKNCDKSNLITTCKRCNLKANGNKTYWKEYYTDILKIKRLTEKSIMYNVGVDVHQFKPVSFEDVITDIYRWEKDEHRKLQKTKKR